MEAGLADAVLKLYHTASGNSSFTAKEVCEEFSKVVIDEPLYHNSGIFGKMPSRRHTSFRAYEAL
jgi:hypothetical protein